MTTKHRIPQQSKVKQGDYQAAGRPFFVRLIPELSAAALKAGLDKELALWYCLRGINSSGSSNPGQQWSSGRLVLNDAVAALVRQFGYTQSTAYRLLQAGSGKLWAIYQIPWLPGLSQIKIYGLYQVAEYLSTSYLSCPVEVKARDFRGLKNRRAWLYASFFKPDGSRAKPISRDSINAATGVLRRQQQRYDKVVRIKRVANFAFQQDGHGLVPMFDLVEGKRSQYRIVRRLGNTYHSRALKAHKGMTKKANAELRHRSLNSDEARLPKRFFLSARSLVRCLERATEVFLLVNKRDRRIRGRMEWCLA
ncbi:hypothetical protein ES703_46419 [subsurface metagenome]